MFRLHHHRRHRRLSGLLILAALLTGWLAPLAHATLGRGATPGFLSEVCRAASGDRPAGSLTADAAPGGFNGGAAPCVWCVVSLPLATPGHVGAAAFAMLGTYATGAVHRAPAVRSGVVLHARPRGPPRV